MERVFSESANILALGAESAGIFAVCKNGNIFISENFGDLLNDANFLRYKKAVMDYFPPKADQSRAGKKEKIKPGVILTDLHPLYKTTAFGEELAGRYKIPHVKIQHHIAHIFSAVGDFLLLQTKDYRLKTKFFGIAMDGTGYGLDGNIWGGEIFKITNYKLQITKQFQNQNFKTNIKNSNLNIERIGSLEEQIMIGGDLAVREPARMVIAILAKIKNQKSKIKATAKNLKSIDSKDDIYNFVGKFYTRNEFEMLYNQMEQGFNCQTTTSTGRVLDAVSVLLGFSENERNYKHEATKKLEENSGKPYTDLKPQISFSAIESLPSAGGERGNTANIATGKRLFHPRQWAGPRNDNRAILQTTPLFEYLIKNINKDKKRLAATAQLYIAKGLCELTRSYTISHKSLAVFAAGGMANNKIISKYLENRGVYLSKKILRGDEGIAVGQIVYYFYG